MKWSRHAIQEPAEPAHLSPAPTPSSLETRLAECAEREPSELSSRILDSLEMLDRSSLTAAQRLRLIEPCCNAASVLRRNPVQSKAGSGLPLPDDKIKLANRYAEIYCSIAQHCKKVTEELVSGGDHHLGDATYLLGGCYQGIANLGEYLLVEYERYARARKGVWLDIHRFYRLAVSADLHNADIAPRRDQPSQTVEHVYKKVLLLGLSDPFHHPPRRAFQIYSRLDKWARLASLTASPPASGRCSFTVNPEVDRPAMPTPEKATIRPQPDEQYLVTRGLVNKLKTQHRRAVKMALKRVEQAEGATKELESIELLRRLVVNWGLHPIRHTTRTRTCKSCDMVVGIKSVCTALNGLKPLPGWKIGTSGKWVKVMKRVIARPSSDFADFAWIISRWNVEDENEQGWRLGAAANTVASRVRVGELIALRTGYEWQVGCVRWAQNNDGNRLCLGIRKIPGSARPAFAYRLPDDDPPARNLVPALLLADRINDGYRYSLLCDKRLYRPMGSYLVQPVGGKDRRVFESTDVRLSTQSFVWCELRVPEDDLNGRHAG